MRYTSQQQGRLTGSIQGVHDTAITDMSVLHSSDSSSDSDCSSALLGTVGADGTLKLWRVTCDQPAPGQV
jgi:hypothetical protein